MRATAKISPDGSCWSIETQPTYFERVQRTLDDHYKSKRLTEPVYRMASMATTCLYLVTLPMLIIKDEIDYKMNPPSTREELKRQFLEITQKQNV